MTSRCIGCLERNPDEDLDDRWLCPVCAARQDVLNDLLFRVSVSDSLLSDQGA